MALQLFAATLFVSAFLLFLVQPMIGKMILPKLGGTPQVWNTCMLFFQMALLAGYGYTHWISTKLPLRRQILIHCSLLALPLLFLLPFGPFNVTNWIPPAGTNPIGATLLLLTVVVGVPFFVVSTSAPLLQKWFASTGDPAAKDPYFLYGASNLGSLLSLVCYPFLVEPFIPLRPQAWVWTVSYLVLAGLVVVCALRVFKSLPAMELSLAPAGVSPAPEITPAPVPALEPPPPVPQPSTAVKAGPAPSAARTGITRKKGVRVPGRPTGPQPAVAVAPDLSLPRTDDLTWVRRLRWVLLAFAPSSLMLGVTSYVSMDLSPFPLLWVIPLALYLITFILVFAKWPVVWTGVPHNIILFVQPFFLLGLCLIILRRSFDPYLATMFSFLGFFLTALMCHGELARDRPTPKHLTEFFLLMAVGGALGGLFNALIAPQVFVGVAEYPIAIIAACFLRPRQKDDGWFDELLLSAFPGFQTWVRDSGDQLAQNMGKPAPRSNYLLNYSLDIFFGLFILGLALFLKTNADTSWGWLKNDPSKNGLLKIMKFFGLPNSWHTGLYQIGVYGIPMIFCLFFSFSRPVRFGLAVAMVLLANLVIIGRGEENLIYAGRSYFGVLRVLEDIEGIRDPDIDQAKLNLDAKRPFATYTYLMHGTTYHGRNYQTPTDLRRLATTYYHRKGPVGVIMERYNWFPGKQNTYAADARLPVSMIGLGATPLGGGSLEQLVSVWTEPPYATIGLGSGTMASFGRCFQHVTYYEIDDNIRNFSLPPSERFLWENKADNKGEKKDPYFTYLVDAVGRGSNLEVIMGDARLSMKEERPQVSNLYSLPIEKGAFSTKHNLPGAKVSDFSKREKYYKVIVVDAFSSDAIPIHLITKEAIELYFSKLAEDGVLCVHTSNRHMDLVKPVSDIAKALGKAARVGHDVTKRRDVPPYLGHFGSEYVMLANDEKFLPKEGTIELSENTEQQWFTPVPPRMSLWTDDFSNIVSILR